jgi:hypothetical protein
MSYIWEVRFSWKANLAKTGSCSWRAEFTCFRFRVMVDDNTVMEALPSSVTFIVLPCSLQFVTVLDTQFGSQCLLLPCRYWAGRNSELTAG